MRNVKQNYSPDETKALQRGMEFHKKCEDSGVFAEIKSPDSLVKMKLVHVDGESLVTGKGTTVVDASAEDCAAFEYYMSSRACISYNKEDGIYDVTYQEINQVSNEGTKITYTESPNPKPQSYSISHNAAYCLLLQYKEYPLQNHQGPYVQK